MKRDHVVYLIGSLLLLLLVIVAAPLPYYEKGPFLCKDGGKCPTAGWGWGGSALQNYLKKSNPVQISTPIDNEKPPVTSNGQNTVTTFNSVGVIVQVDCANAGLGCFEFQLKVNNQERYAMTDIIEPHRYVGRRVRVSGDWTEQGAAGFVKVRTIEIVE